MNIQESIVQTNLDYQEVMSRVIESERRGDMSAYELLMAEAEDLANYIYSLINDN